MEVIRAQLVLNCVAGFLGAPLKTGSSYVENHRLTFEGKRVRWLSQALDEPLSVRVVTGFPEPDAGS